MTRDIEVAPLTPGDSTVLLSLIADVFGPGRFARTSSRLREVSSPHNTAWYLAQRGEQCLGAVALTAVTCGPHHGRMLGPIAVRPACRGDRIGSRLVRHAITMAEMAEARFVLLVGDPRYFCRFGFVPVPAGQLVFPGPVDPDRVMVRWLDGTVPVDFCGEVKPDTHDQLRPDSARSSPQTDRASKPYRPVPGWSIAMQPGTQSVLRRAART